MPEVRSTTEIFENLRYLCREPGFLHAISSIILRDFFLSVDLTGEVKRDQERRYSRSRLNNNELMLLVGLLTQSDNANVFERIADTNALVSRADSLLEEFHECLEAPMREMIQVEISPDESRAHFGDFAKEAIYYGAESAFTHQYKKFARYRYRNDVTWLLANKGLSILPMIEISSDIIDRVNSQISELMYECTSRAKPAEPSEVTNALLISKEYLIWRFKARAKAFLDLFSTPINNGNGSFTCPFAFNGVNAAPLIDLGEYIFLSSQYRLSESLYESPYYWMLADPEYKDTASIHRGVFLENTITHLLNEIFGKDHVFSNVLIRRGKSEIAAEADVLVVYGEFVLVVQAKSKRLTLEARSGNLERIKSDFGSGVQAAYDQAINVIDLIISGAECEIRPGNVRRFEFLARAFPIVVLSDHFPSLTIISHHLVKRTDDRSPVVLDIFFLDALREVINDPVEVLYYLQQRARFFEKITADSEFVLLGYHMKQKLFIEDKIDMMWVYHDFAADIDDYLTAKEAGRPHANEFLGIEERIGVPKMAELISFLKSGPPEVAGAAIDLLDYSGETLQRIADNIGAAQKEVKEGKPFKAFSIETQYGGISYVAVRLLDRQTLDVAERIGHLHKYRTSRDRWYVLVDHVYSRSLIDRVLPICDEWVASEEMENFTQETESLLKSTYVSFDSTQLVSEDNNSGTQ